MNKAIFEDNTNQDIQTSALQISSSLKNDPIVLKTFEKNHISTSFLETHPGTIKRWLDTYKPCVGCKGLKFCKQKQVGYFDNIIDDGFLHTEKKACKFKCEELIQTRHLNNYLVNDLPTDLRTVTFENIELKDESIDYLSVLKQAQTSCSSLEGLYLYGTMGSGKTYLAACASNYYAKENKKVAFVHYPSFVQRMTSQMNGSEYREELNKLKYAYFVVLDDIGAESVNEWNRDTILLPLLNERYEKHLTTWFTSNEDLKTLKEHYSYTKSKQEEVKALRILERIQAMAKPCKLTTESRRIYL